MSINIKEFANKYSLKSNDLIQMLANAGVVVADDSVELSVEQMVLLKQQVSQKKPRGTLKLKAKSAPVTPEIALPEVAVENTTAGVADQVPEKGADQSNHTAQSDMDQVRSHLSVKPTVATVKKSVKQAPDSKPKASDGKRIEVMVNPAKKRKAKSGARQTRQEREEAQGDVLAMQTLSQHSSPQLSHQFELPAEPVEREIRLPELIVVSDLANQLALKASVVVMKLMNLGVMVTINQTIDQDTAMLVVEELGHRAILVKDEEEKLMDLVDRNDAPMQRRAPVVTVMGHVDHGKTTLLDTIRRSQVVAAEAGGITQHIGAYAVDTGRGPVTFLDTPGHEAFTAMRARGAQCTDIVVLVVAADDGVMPQTIEGIQHAKAAKVPIVVAVNKMDKEDADPERVKAELAQHDVMAESWGGDVLFQEISAKVGTGVDELLENLALQAEMLELQAPATGLASGLVVEAVLDKGVGAVATLLVQSGCLQKGDVVLIGSEYGRVRALSDSHGNRIDAAGPSVPVKITGLSGVPSAGEFFMVMATERAAREYAMSRQYKKRDKRLSQAKPKPLEQLFQEAQSGKTAVTLNLVIKADTHGSAEALAESVKKLSTEQIEIKVIGVGVGRLNESDVNLAYASSAMVVGFNVRADVMASRLMQAKSIKPFYCSVIYDLIAQVKAAVKGLEAPVYSEETVGLVEIREVFRSSKFGVAAGCMVLEGLIKRNALVRVLREDVVIHQGVINSLRRLKDDVAEVKTGVECGIGIKDYTDIKVGDRLETFVRKEDR